MASVFGISGLRSRLDSWWSVRRNAEQQAFAGIDPGHAHLTLVPRSDDDFNLSLVLENLVIPKLIAGRARDGVVHEAAPLSQFRTAAVATAIDSDEIDQFSKLAISGDTGAMLDFVDKRLADGSSVEAIFVELLAPAARRLGEYWEADSDDFVGVTMGLWRIQEVLRELALRVPPTLRPGHGARSALFSPMPGDQHNFGTMMVAECFERAGWDADILVEPTQSELLEKLAYCQFDLIALTVTNDCTRATLGSLVRSIKAVSCNPKVRILLGGRFINENPGLVEECGADATAIDAPSAVALADHLVPAKADYLERLF